MFDINGNSVNYDNPEESLRSVISTLKTQLEIVRKKGTKQQQLDCFRTLISHYDQLNQLLAKIEEEKRPATKSAS